MPKISYMPLIHKLNLNQTHLMVVYHDCMPDSFSLSVIIQIVKDKFCKCDTLFDDNYKPISLVSTFASD